MVPLDGDGPTYEPYQPWSDLRLIDVLQADGLILVLFGRKEKDDGSIYLYAEDLTPYEISAPSDIRFATVLIISHMDEFLGKGWEDLTPSMRIGRLVVLRKGAFASAEA